MTRAAALAFGVFKTTDLLKQVFTRSTGLTPQPYLKSAASMALAGAVAVAYERGWRERLLMASAVAGGAAVLHEGYELLSTGADRNKVLVVQQAARAAASGVSPSSRPGRRVQPL